VNPDLDKLSKEKSRLIVQVTQEVISGKLDGHDPEVSSQVQAPPVTFDARPAACDSSQVRMSPGPSGFRRSGRTSAFVA